MPALATTGIQGPNVVADSRLPSTAIWKDCPFYELMFGERDGFAYFNDFISGGQTNNVAAAASTLGNGLVAFTGATAGSNILSEVNEPYGSAILQSTTDDEAVVIAALASNNVAGQCVFAAGMKLWMEARIKVDVITDDLTGFFLGFAEEALADNTGLITTGDAMTDKDYVGFHKNADDSFTTAAAVNAVYNTAGGATAPVTVISAAHTLVADTYVKLGLYCDGTSTYYFVNGAKNAASVLLTAVDFPDGEEMAWYLYLRNKGGGDAKMNIDWVRIAQQRA